MRFIPLFSIFLFGAANFAPAHVEAAAKPSPKSQFVLSGNDVPSIAMAEWKTPDGKMHVAKGAQVKSAPSSAVRYSIKSVKWPSGYVRVLTFPDGVLHAISDETEIYVMKGGATVDVGHDAVTLSAGDVAVKPSGVISGAASSDGTVLVEWTVGSLAPDQPPSVVRGADVPAKGEVVKLQRYVFPGNSIRVATLAAGGKTDLSSAAADSLIYFAKGRAVFYEGDEVHDVRGGDFIFEEHGQHHRWEHIDESLFVTTTGIPADAGNVNAQNAVDHGAVK